MRRDVIACSDVIMVEQGQDLLMRAPSPANAKQLKELHLKIVYPEKD